jgi:hypothetical protein
VTLESMLALLAAYALFSFTSYQTAKKGIFSQF